MLPHPDTRLSIGRVQSLGSSLASLPNSLPGPQEEEPRPQIAGRTVHVISGSDTAGRATLHSTCPGPGTLVCYTHQLTGPSSHTEGGGCPHPADVRWLPKSPTTPSWSGSGLCLRHCAPCRVETRRPRGTARKSRVTANLGWPGLPPHHPASSGRPHCPGLGGILPSCPAGGRGGGEGSCQAGPWRDAPRGAGGSVLWCCEEEGKHGSDL